MDPNTSRVVFTGVLDTYLVVSSFLVSFWLIVSEFELFKFLILAFILLGNCYWIFKLQSFARLKNFYIFLGSTISLIQNLQYTNYHKRSIIAESII